MTGIWRSALLRILAATGMLWVFAACAEVPAAPQPEAARMAVVAPARVWSARFLKNQVIEIAFSSVREGKFDQLVKDYFPKVMPIATEYGGSLVASFRVEQVLAGTIRPQMGAFFTWPSVDAFMQIVQDPRVQALMPIRDAALDYINEANFFIVAADTELRLDMDRSYELIGETETESKEGLHGALLSLRPASQTLGSFRPEVLHLREISDADCRTPRNGVRLQIRFNPQS